MLDILQTIFWVVAYTVAYFAILFIFPYFFEKRKVILPTSKQNLRSLGVILVLVIVLFVIMWSIPDKVWANRFQHAICGGFLAFIICFRAAKDSRVSIGKFQFFLFSALVVTALGVGNEIMECIAQNTTSLVMASYINDTWLDLISNTTGLLIGAALFVPKWK